MIRISPEQLEALLAQGGHDLVDVREASEWAGGHLPGARHVPLGVLLAAPADHLPRDRVIFVCAHGVRSQTACLLARRAGLAEVYSLDGGLAAWAAEGRPLA